MAVNKNTCQTSYDGLEIQFGNCTDVGRKRQANEDYFANFKTANGRVFLVCDGMGGHVGGEKASRIAVDAIRTYLTEKTDGDIAQLLSVAISYANSAILEYAQTHPELKGMGSTCVVLLIRDGKYFVAHVGDSRAYLYSGGTLRRLTKDHSFVQGLIDIGELSEAEAEKHPRKNEITNALGLERMKPATITELSQQPGKDDLLLLCSDGLTGMVDERTIGKVLADSSTFQEKAEKLVALANEAGGLDNITVQIIGTDKSNSCVSEAKPVLPKAKKTMLTVLLAGIFIGVLVTAVLGNIDKIKHVFFTSKPTSFQQSRNQPVVTPDTDRESRSDTMNNKKSDTDQSLIVLNQSVSSLKRTAESLLIAATDFKDKANAVYEDANKSNTLKPAEQQEINNRSAKVLKDAKMVRQKAEKLKIEVKSIIDSLKVLSESTSVRAKSDMGSLPSTDDTGKENFAVEEVKKRADEVQKTLDRANTQAQSAIDILVRMKSNQIKNNRSHNRNKDNGSSNNHLPAENQINNKSTEPPEREENQNQGKSVNI